MKRVNDKLLFLVISLLLLFLPSPLSAEVREYHMDNGLKILIIEDHKAPIATFQIWYRVGSRNEVSGKTGISHFLEHMMFKGTSRHGAMEFSRMIQKNGGTNNAYTTRDYTVYHETIASDRMNLPMDLEADRMQNLLLSPDDVKYERSVVMEERRMRYEDDPQTSLFEEVMATAFKVHPYRNPVIGWMSEISSLNRDDLLLQYQRFYSPDNAVIVATGDIHADETFEKIRNIFGKIPKGPVKQPLSSLEPPQRGEKRVFLKKEAELPYILISFHVPNFPHEDSAPLDVLNSVLSGKSGRLYQSLVKEERIALNIFASYNGFYRDPFLFLIGGTVTTGREIESLEKSIYKEIESLKSDPPTEREIQKAKNQVEASFIMEQDSITSQAELIGMFEMLGGWRLNDQYLEGIKRVTPDDVQRVAKKYFREDNRTVGILIPEERK